MNILGPEFQRHVWLRFSWFSVLIMPILLGAAILLCFMTWQVNYDAHNERQIAEYYLPLYDATPHWSFLVYLVARPMVFVVLFVLGAYEAASSFTIELRNKTWDMHKISAIRPIHLMIGKLFGVTSYAWFFSIGVCFAALYGYAHTFEDVTPPVSDFAIGPIQPYFLYPDYEDMFYLSFSVVISAFVGHLIAALVSLQYLRRNRTGTFLPLALGVGVALLCLRVLTATFDVMFFEGNDLFRSIQAVDWYNQIYERNDFVLGVVLYVIFWGVVGLYRLIRAELNFPTYPIFLSLFLVSLCVLIGGFQQGVNQAALEKINQMSVNFTRYFPAFFIFYCVSYITIYSSSEDVGRYLRFYRSVVSGRRALQFLPTWFIPLLLSVSVFLFWQYKVGEGMGIPVTAFALSAFLILVRDGLVLHICLLGNRYKRGGLMIASYYIFAYILLPFLVFYSLIWGLGVDLNASLIWDENFNYRYIFGAFFPYGHSRLDSAVLPLSIINIVLLFALWRSTRIYRIVSS